MLLTDVPFKFKKIKTQLKGMEIKDSTQKRETTTQPTLTEMQQNLQYLFNLTHMQCRCIVNLTEAFII